MPSAWSMRYASWRIRSDLAGWTTTISAKSHVREFPYVRLRANTIGTGSDLEHSTPQRRKRAAYRVMPRGRRSSGTPGGTRTPKLLIRSHPKCKLPNLPNGREDT